MNKTENKFTLVFTDREVDIVYQALLELPAKISMPVIDTLKYQLSAIISEMEKPKEEIKESKK